jgi:hypothetical protein
MTRETHIPARPSPAPNSSPTGARQETAGPLIAWFYELARRRLL